MWSPTYAKALDDAPKTVVMLLVSADSEPRYTLPWVPHLLRCVADAVLPGCRRAERHMYWSWKTCCTALALLSQAAGPSPGSAFKAEVPEALNDHFNHSSIAQPYISHELAMLFADCCDLHQASPDCPSVQSYQARNLIYSRAAVIAYGLIQRSWSKHTFLASSRKACV